MSFFPFYTSYMVLHILKPVNLLHLVRIYCLSLFSTVSLVSYIFRFFCTRPGVMSRSVDVGDKSSPKLSISFDVLFKFSNISVVFLMLLSDSVQTKGFLSISVLSD